jgi:outer membrane protein TolC
MLLSPLALGAGAQLPDHPLTLEECIALGKRLNPSLVVARQSVLSADANLRRSLSSYYPTAAFVATQGRAFGSSFVETAAGTIAFASSTRRRESEVVLTQTVWQTGRGESVWQAQHGLVSTRASERATHQGLIWSICQLYYQALAAEELVEVREAALVSSRDHEKLVRARAEVGEAAPIDLVPAEARTAEAEFLLVQVENDADLTKARLKSTIGLPQTQELELAGPQAGGEEVPMPSLEDALGVALKHRPEIIALRESTVAGEYAVELAEAVENAVVSVSAQYERGLAGPREGESWSVVASLTGFLFDGGARRADVDAARANLLSLKAQEQELVNAIGLEVESALVGVETARESVATAEKSAESAEAQLAAAEGKYREGVGIFVEILDAQEAATRARTNRVRALYDYQTALFALRKALGTLDDGTEAGDWQ